MRLRLTFFMPNISSPFALILLLHNARGWTRKRDSLLAELGPIQASFTVVLDYRPVQVRLQTSLTWRGPDSGDIMAANEAN
jgi:hypothetical protein